MLPILLIHGYCSEGKDNTAEKIYGSLPTELKKSFGQGKVKNLNLSRWITLSDGVMLDDVSYAMNRALTRDYPDLLATGFHIVIHSTGALVVRNWIKNYSPKPCPIQNLVHLAGANFGSGLAHIGQGQLSRWKNLLSGMGVGTKVLDALEFGCSKTLDLHLHFLKPNNDMYNDYKVREFNVIGSQTLTPLRAVPIRYVKEDSSDNTVRTSATNLNFNYIPVKPKAKAYSMGVKQLKSLMNKRMKNQKIADSNYEFNLSFLSKQRQQVPYAVAFETAHFGEDIGIVSGKKNRPSIMPLIKTALTTAETDVSYQTSIDRFKKMHEKTFDRAAKLKWKLIEWDPQEQYEGHAQLIFRIRDQFGNGVDHFDVMMNSEKPNKDQYRLEKMIEDHHVNKKDAGIITFYLRTQKFNSETLKFDNLLGKVAALDIEVTGHETETKNIAFIPLSIRLSTEQIQLVVEAFKTTIIDIELVRLPADHVFHITRKK